jgi:hypothetical protein
VSAFFSLPVVGGWGFAGPALRLWDVTIKGAGLLQLIRDAKRHRIDILTVSPRHQIVLGGEGLVVKEIVVKEATQ